ncbi:hypothetical protein OIU76_017033 [Salix suchowensis]|nr:hypothetical protein OIU76_017033 [Salix suchowensis]
MFNQLESLINRLKKKCWLSELSNASYMLHSTTTIAWKGVSANDVSSCMCLIGPGSATLVLDELTVSGFIHSHISVSECELGIKGWKSSR